MGTIKLGKFEYDEAELDRQHKAAVKRGKEMVARLPKAVAARYDAVTKRFVLDMKNGSTFLLPANLIQGLQAGSDEELADFSLIIEGTQIHWHALDVQFYIEDLLRGVFGTPRWMENVNRHLAEIGRKGGQSTSVAKRKASAENGKKGGRPRLKKAI